MPDPSCVWTRQPAWMENCAFTPKEAGVLTSANGRVGLGAVLIVECSATGRFLMARKSFRAGYEMNDRLAFPGGMVRGSEETATMSDMIAISLEQRARAEAGISFGDIHSLVPLHRFPPVAATYTVRGHAVTTAIIAFHALVDHEVAVAAQDDGSTYDARWRDLDSIWPEISFANSISLAQLVWGRLTTIERRRVRTMLDQAAQKAIEDARRAELPAPAIPWH